MKNFLIALLLLPLFAQAALVADSDEPLPYTPVKTAPNEMLGMLVCKPAGRTACAESRNFTTKEYRFLDYVRMKTHSSTARIIGLQFDPRNNNLYIFFAMPELPDVEK